MSDNTKKWILKEVLPLVVVVGGAVGGSVLWITSELADVRSEIADVRSDLSADIAHLRSEVSEDIARLRSEISEDIADLRAELSEDIADLRERVASVEVKLDLLAPGDQETRPGPRLPADPERSGAHFKEVAKP